MMIMSNDKKVELKKQDEKQSRVNDFSYRPGSISNNIITQRNRGVKHQFLDNIGGCSSNYR